MDGDTNTRIIPNRYGGGRPVSYSATFDANDTGSRVVKPDPVTELYYLPRDGDSIRITVDPDGKHYAVYGAYEDGKPYRGYGDFHADASGLHFDTWHPFDPDA